MPLLGHGLEPLDFRNLVFFLVEKLGVVSSEVKTIRHDHRKLSSQDEDSYPMDCWHYTDVMHEDGVCVCEACWGFAGSCVVSVHSVRWGSV